jgi:hypothetical protein
MKTLPMLKEKARFFADEFYVFDVETTGLRAKSDAFVFGVIYGHNFVKVLYSVEDFKKEFLNERYKKRKVFAHNAEFDLSVIYDNIFIMDNKAIFNGKFICATNGNCLFADSLNIFETSVKVLGKMVGLEKFETPNKFKTGIINEVTQDDIKYCTRDCEIVFEALAEIFEMVGNIKITIAGLSLDLFRRKYQTFHIDYNDELGRYFFSSYYGGRCEAFYIGRCNASVYDINSMYPYAMVACQFPNPKFLKKISFCHPKIFIQKYLKLYEGCAYFKIKHKDHYFGFLPYRFEGKLLFPIGTFSGWYNFNEIRFCLENDVIEILEVKDIIYAPPLTSPFATYATDLYKKRFETGNEFHAYLYKKFGNSLYGKFAQKIDSEFIYIKDMEKDYAIIKEFQDKKQIIKIQLFNEKRNDCFIQIIKSGNKYMYNTIPLFSSYITSFSRVQLMGLLLKYRNFDPLYCDTDSIFFERDPKIKSSKLLGQFKKEEKSVIEISGLKNYSYIYEGKINKKIKGIPKNAKFKKGSYNYNAMVRTKEGIRQNKEIGVWTKRKKTITGKYDKRIVKRNGYTEPIKF